MDAASGTIEIPDNAITRRLSKNLKQAAAELEITASAEPAEIDREQLEEQLFNAMDEVPEGWMVRSNRCGSSALKALAGFGAIGHQVPEVRFGPYPELGPGGVRVGNGRRIRVFGSLTVQDEPHRFVW